jgi:hypothetical protein
MLEEVIEFVDNSFKFCATEYDPSHFQRTVYWASQLRPSADEAILIAAYAHDIQRAFRPTNTEQTFRDREMNDAEFLRLHQQKGAEIIADFLRTKNYDERYVQRVYNIVNHHEEGGDDESDLVKDADSLSYFETNAIKHAQKTSRSVGKEKIRRKIEWMFNRISSLKAKQIAKTKYEEVLRLLDEA